MPIRFEFQFTLIYVASLHCDSENFAGILCALRARIHSDSWPYQSSFLRSNEQVPFLLLERIELTCMCVSVSICDWNLFTRNKSQDTFWLTRYKDQFSGKIFNSRRYWVFVVAVYSDIEKVFGLINRIPRLGKTLIYHVVVIKGPDKIIHAQTNLMHSCLGLCVGVQSYARFQWRNNRKPWPMDCLCVNMWVLWVRSIRSSRRREGRTLVSQLAGKPIHWWRDSVPVNKLCSFYYLLITNHGLLFSYLSYYSK